MAAEKELKYDIPNVIRIYKDGTVDRLMAFPYVSPSLNDPTTGISSKDVTIVADQVSARLYLPKLTPTEPTKLPILVYFHGGGFILGSAFTLLEHKYLSTIVSYVKAIVVSVEYRLAPEHLLPAAYDDSWTALRWVASHQQPDPENPQNQEPWLTEFGDFDKIYLGGDSAGGNIVHNMALQAGREKLKILGGFLGCPYFWSSSAGKSSPDESVPYVCWKIANPDAPEGIDDPLVNPFVKVGFAAEYGCRKLLVVAAEKDTVRDINVKYVEAVKESDWDGEIELFEIEGEDHCFYCFNGDAGKAKLVMERLASFIV